MYDTGIAIQPPHGYYFDLVGRSSISKSGYMLANNVGIIDASYQGSIKVALYRLSDATPELLLPARVVQIIPRKVPHFEPLELSAFAMRTSRAEGGFGSTGGVATS